MTRVVITGANRGLGLALAQQYTKPGAQGDRWVPQHPAAADALADAGAEVQAARHGQQRVDHRVRQSDRRSAVDVLFNNAGIDARAVGAADGERGALDITEQQFRRRDRRQRARSVVDGQGAGRQPHRARGHDRQRVVAGRLDRSRPPASAATSRTTRRRPRST